MKLRSLMVINTVVSAVFGISFGFGYFHFVKSSS